MIGDLKPTYTNLYCKVGDTARAVRDTLVLDDAAIDLSGATVALVWKPVGGTVSRLSATIIDSATGVVEYTLTSAEVALPQDVILEWEVTFADTSVLTIPTNKVIYLHIREDRG